MLLSGWMTGHIVGSKCHDYGSLKCMRPQLVRHSRRALCVEDIGSHFGRNMGRQLVTTASAVAPAETVNASSVGCNRGSHWQVWCCGY
jgi:hypothetical protein